MKFAETNDKGNEYKVIEDDLSAQTRSISPIHQNTKFAAQEASNRPEASTPNLSIFLQ